MFETRLTLLKVRKPVPEVNELAREIKLHQCCHRADQLLGRELWFRLLLERVVAVLALVLVILLAILFMMLFIVLLVLLVCIIVVRFLRCFCVYIDIIAACIVLRCRRGVFKVGLCVERVGSLGLVVGCFLRL